MNGNTEDSQQGANINWKDEKRKVWRRNDS